MKQTELCAAAEAMLFVSGEPVAIRDLAAAMECDPAELRKALLQLREQYEREERGILLRFVDEKAQLCTDAKYAGCIERLLQPAKNNSFSQSVLETLSIIAYKQPVTRAEIEAIRGVRCEYALNQLLTLGFIEETGRKNAIGRPALFGTTEKFLLHFGLESIEKLPQREQILYAQEQEAFALSKQPEKAAEESEEEQPAQEEAPEQEV